MTSHPPQSPFCPRPPPVFPVQDGERERERGREKEREEADGAATMQRYWEGGAAVGFTPSAATAAFPETQHESTCRAVQVTTPPLPRNQHGGDELETGRRGRGGVSSRTGESEHGGLQLNMHTATGRRSERASERAIGAVALTQTRGAQL